MTDVEMEVSLRRWLLREDERLNAFIGYYLRTQSRYPEDYPETRTMEEWDEQYRAFTND